MVFRSCFKSSFARCTLAFLLMMTMVASGFSYALAAETGYTNADVNVREKASKSSSAICVIAKGEEVTITGSSESWYKVRYGNFSGYVMSQYVDKKGSSAASKIAALGDAPGTMRPGDDNSDVVKLQKALTYLGYFSSKVDGNYGNKTKEAVMAYQKDNGLTADGIAGKKTVTSIFSSCSSTSLSTQSEASDSSQKKKTVSSIAAIGTAPGSSKKGDSGTYVTKLQQALEFYGYYTGTIDGLYGDSTVKAVKAFQKARGLSADGVAGTKTINALFGLEEEEESSSGYRTELLDWFEDHVDSLIPKKSVFEVKDVLTGKIFKCKRWSGGSHIDAEPLTAEDTAIMYEIYGNRWSWSRRAILIRFNGRVFAASMNGMPQGTVNSGNTDNNFDGTFGIHFLNSRTHESDSVDQKHQSKVKIAAKSTW